MNIAIARVNLDLVDLLAITFLMVGGLLFMIGVVVDVRTLDAVLRVFIDEWTPGFVIDGALLLVVNRIIRNNDKRNVLAQVGSYSNDFALDAVRRAEREGWLKDGSMRKQQMRKAKLRGADFSGANLEGIDLRYADLSGASFIQCNLKNANLLGANLTNCDLRLADLTGAQLKWTVLSGAQTEGAIFHGANVQFATVDQDCEELARLPGVAAGGHLHADQVDVLRSSFAEIERSDDQAVSLFYENLFTERPELRSMFSTSQSRQSRKLMQSLKVIIASLDAPERNFELLEQLGVRHAGYGVTHEHYELAGRVLLDTLAEFFGSRFDGAIKESWQSALALIATVMAQATMERAS